MNRHERRAAHATARKSAALKKVGGYVWRNHPLRDKAVDEFRQLMLDGGRSPRLCLSCSVEFSLDSPPSAILIHEQTGKVRAGLCAKCRRL